LKRKQGRRAGEIPLLDPIEDDDENIPNQQP